MEKGRHRYRCRRVRNDHYIGAVSVDVDDNLQ